MAGTHLHTSCPSCGTSYKIRLDILPEGGARVKCRVCEGFITLQRPSRPALWVFTDDPAVQRGDTVRMLEAVPGYDVLLLDAEAREDLLALGDVPGPAAVAFGCMHALLEDPLLGRVCREGAGRILLSTHENDDLQEAVEAFCGADHVLYLPFEPTLLEVVLEDVTVNRGPHDR